MKTGINGWKRLLAWPISDWAICIRLGTHCNVACPYCLSNSSPLGNAPSKDYVDAIFEALRLHPRRVVFTGGEPFLVDTLSDLCRDATRRRIPTKVGTNGRVPLSRYAWLEGADISQLSIDVSLHSTSIDTEGSVIARDRPSSCIEAIAYIRHIGVRVTANIPLLRCESSDMEELIRAVLSAGAEKVKLTRIFDIGRGRRRTTKRTLERRAEDTRIAELIAIFGDRIQTPLPTQELFSDGTVLISEPLQVEIAGTPFECLTDRELEHLSAVNHQIYA